MIMLSLTGMLLYGWLRRDLDKAQSFLLTLTMFCLLPFQILVGWTAISLASIPLLSATFAAVCLRKFALPENTGGIGRAILGCVLATFFLFVALTMFEPSAMFYWTMLALFLLLREESPDNHARARLFVIAFLSSGVAAMVLRFIWPEILFALTDLEPGKRNELVGSFSEALEKARWFFTDPMVRGLNFWSMRNVTIALVTLGIIGVGIVSEFVRAWSVPRSKGVPSAIQCLVEKYIVVAGLILLSCTPILVAAPSLTRYRNLLALTPILFVLFYLGVRAIVHLMPRIDKPQLCKVILAIFCVVSMHVAARNVDAFAKQNELDRRYMRSQLRQAFIQTDMAQIKKIYVRTFGSRAGSLDDKLEFAYIGSSIRWTVHHMAKVILREEGVDVTKFQFLYGLPSDPPPEVRSTALLIDMYPMRYLYDEKEELCEIYPRGETAPRLSYSPLQLLRGNTAIPKNQGPAGTLFWTFQIGDRGSRVANSEYFPVEAGTNIGIRATTYVQQMENCRINVIVYFYDKNGKKLDGTGTSINAAEPKWTNHEVEAVVPKGAVQALVNFMWMPEEGKTPMGVWHCKAVSVATL
jgi:hypothetical protein